MKKQKSTWVAKPAKGKMTVLLAVFGWIVLWNIVFQWLHGLWANSTLQIENWAFFIAVTIFFMQEELTLFQRFVHTLVGGAVGLLLAAGVVLGTKALMSLGLSHFLSICILLVIAIAMLILLSPYFPAVFNNVGFCYFIISLINSEEAVSRLPSHLLSLAAGSICLNLGVIGVLTAVKKAVERKHRNNSTN